MAKDIKSGEETYRESTILGTLSGILTLSDGVSKAVDELCGAEERNIPYIEENGEREYFPDKETRDEEILRRVRE